MIGDLSLRKTEQKSGKKFNPVRDAEIWDSVIQDAIKNLDHQVAQMQKLNTELTQLEKASVKSADDLDAMVRLVRAQIGNQWFSNDF